VSILPGGHSDRGWAAIATGTLLVASIGVMVVSHSIPTLDLAKHAQATASLGDVTVTTKVLLRQDNWMVQVVADVTVANAGEKPVAYIGFSCSNPAAVQYRSTRPDPTGPSYSPSAEALRASVMEYRRSLDALVAFSEDPAGPSTSNPPCDDHAPPELRPHQTLADRQISDLAITGRQYVDSLTTDIVTTLKLGNVPAPGSTAPIQPTGTIEVRIPLRELS
jgi:hypothetical protein